MKYILRLEGLQLLAVIHSGECGCHPASTNLASKAYRFGFYWPTAVTDAKDLVKRCKGCQFFAKQQHLPAQVLRTIPPSWPFAMWGLKDRYGEPEGGEWEPIKILLEGDGNSNKMNTASNTRLRLTTQVGQAHVATGVPLDLGTNTQPSDPKTQWNTKPRVYIPTPLRSVSTTGQTGPCW
jgi:hypothetical protein